METAPDPAPRPAPSDDAPVTRAEFERLIAIVRDMAHSIRSHVHELYDIDGGGETKKPDQWCDDEIMLISNRLAALAEGDTHAGD